MVKRSCVFMDRDGVINRSAPPGEYIRSWQEFRLIPEVVDWIRIFNALGILVIVVTNQRCVARGLVSSAVLDEIHESMVRQLSESGARIDDLFVCPHDENQCECRKPKPGLILSAARKWNLDLESSVLIGDSASDRALAAECRLAFIEVRHGNLKSFISRDTWGNASRGGTDTRSYS